MLLNWNFSIFFPKYLLDCFLFKLVNVLLFDLIPATCKVRRTKTSKYVWNCCRPTSKNYSTVQQKLCCFQRCSFCYFSIVKQYNQCNLDALEVYAPGSVAETMAPKNRQSVKKKSPPSCPTCFISITQPYISNLTEEQRVD